MARPKDPAKTDENGVYLSMKRSWARRAARTKTVYISDETHSLALRKMKKHGLKTISETVKRGLEVL